MTAPRGDETVPPDAACALHPGRPGSFLCVRCGDFGCDGCAHRVQPTAQPLCASCWRQREIAAGELRRGEGNLRLWILAGAALLLLIWLAVVAGIFAGAL